MGASSKGLFSSAPKDNHALAAEIHAFVGKCRHTQESTLPRDDGRDEPDETQLKSLLQRLYNGICDMGRYRGSLSSPDKTVLAAWESFLEPINALGDFKPHGHMMAARMLLYLSSSFLAGWTTSRKFPMSMSSSKPISLRCDLLIALDDALLFHLKQIWIRSNDREMFPWAFTHYPVSGGHADTCPNCRGDAEPGLAANVAFERRMAERLRAACVTRPGDLTPENGVRPRWRWTRPEGDTTDYPQHPDCSRAGYDVYDKDQHPRLIIWQDIGTDGPLREGYHYTIVDEDTGRDCLRKRPMLRRSRQFVLDAQKVATSHLARDRRRSTEMILARSPLPVELQLEVRGYLDELAEPPWLSKLDLAGAYQPFPKVGEKCTECDGLGHKAAERMARATCPQKTIWIWSLPLRAFHRFHPKNVGKWVLCIDKDCNGHHRDSSWSGPPGGAVIENHLDQVLQSRLGPDTSVKSIGMGPLDPVQIERPDEDHARELRLFSGDSDEAGENHWRGINGLVDNMLHGRALLGLHGSGRSTTEPQWGYGRTRQDEQRTRSAFMENHAHCFYC